MKLISWNIDSLNAALTSNSGRAILSRQVLDTIVSYNPDVLALQETKLSSKGPTKKHLDILGEYFPDYELVWTSSCEPARKGYAGTMTLFKKHYTPEVSFPTINAPHPMDCEGRIITLEFDEFYVSQVYTPNAGNELKRLDDRQLWDVAYADYLAALDQKKPVLATGDFNVAHQEIDLAHPENNRRNAGFTDEERQGFTNLINRGFTDTFRFLNPEAQGQYTWWAQRVKTSKINNSGWRIDYWLVSNRIMDKVKQSLIIDSGSRQDHTPIMLEINLTC